MKGLICERCGWEQNAVEFRPPEIDDWPEFLPPPPPLPMLSSPHPVGVCPSPWKIGDVVWWDIGGHFPDLPPIRAHFAGVESFSSPDYTLEEGEWVMKGAGYELAGAKVIFDKRFVLPAHPYTGDETGVVVLFRDLTAAARWPTSVGTP